tara:strand:- start:361 stop:570 length:210 start_codon:yes stop_codon:yes gene_type:complete
VLSITYKTASIFNGDIMITYSKKTLWLEHAPAYNFELNQDELLVKALKYGLVKKVGYDEYIKTEEDNGK